MTTESSKKLIKYYCDNLMLIIDEENNVNQIIYNDIYNNMINIVDFSNANEPYFYDNLIKGICEKSIKKYCKNINNYKYVKCSLYNNNLYTNIKIKLFWCRVVY